MRRGIESYLMSGNAAQVKVRRILVPVAVLLALAALFLILQPILFSDFHCSRLFFWREQRSVILIVADALRADRLGCYGFELPTSPAIDRLARGGTLFRNYKTVVPSTLASFASVLTSRHPKDHGAFRNGFIPFDEALTMGEVFQDEGFETAAFVSSYCLHSDFGMNKGFDHFDATFGRTTLLPDNQLVRSAADVTDAFLAWHGERKKGRPFFAMIHYFDPHYPYAPPERFVEKFRRKAGGATSAGLKEIDQVMAALRSSQGEPDDLALDLHALYCAEIGYMDEQIGRLLEAVAKAGGDEETIVVFTSDHGETFWDHEDYFNHGLTLFDTAIDIPLIVHCPGLVPAGIERDEPLSNIDLAPTLCRLAGVPVPDGFRGAAFDGLVLDEENAALPEFRFAEATKPKQAERNALRPNFNKAKCVMRGPWKYQEMPFTGLPGELYNMEDDPYELTNLADDPEYADIRKALKGELGIWKNDFVAGKKRESQMSEETRQRLKELGY